MVIVLCKTTIPNIYHVRTRISFTKSVNWWKTPPDSPDINPIENLWHEVKEYIRREVKLRSKVQLVDGILSFWRTVNVSKCRKYIKIFEESTPTHNSSYEMQQDTENTFLPTIL